jgi:nucleotide-binding universal stress UspA family protein
MENKILIPLDFEEQSLLALEYAMYFSDILNSEIHLLHIIEESGALKRMFKDKKEFEKLEKDVQKLLDFEKDKFGIKYKVVTKIKIGKVYEQIEEYIKEIDPVFILMGKTEKPNLRKRILGSNTLHIVNEVKHPVISIRGEKVNKPSNEERIILVPLDINRTITEQITASIEFAKLLKSKIKLITVDRTDSAAQETKLLVKLKKTQNFITELGIDCDIEFIDDSKTPIFEIISKNALESNAHLVVIMTRDEDNVLEFFMGSNARSILETCDIPVLSVKPWDKDSKDSIFKILYDPLNIYKK